MAGTITDSRLFYVYSVLGSDAILQCTKRFMLWIPAAMLARACTIIGVGIIEEAYEFRETFNTL